MSTLSDLRAALQQATDVSLHGLTFEWKELDKEVERMRKWLGNRGAEKPAADAVLAALGEFVRIRELKNLRQAVLVCFGCGDPLQSGKFGLIEDGERFPGLLNSVNAFRSTPRAFRRCYRGLLSAYFSYDVEKGSSTGRENWERLRAFLRDGADSVVAPGLQPGWVDALMTNRQLLGPDPGAQFGRELLEGRHENFDQLRETLTIGDNSWLVWRVVLGQIEAATAKDDPIFRQAIPSLLDILRRHRLALNLGLAALLKRYRACRNPIAHEALRDFAVEAWGNPWLRMNAMKWSQVRDDERTMVANWLKLVLIQKFFSLLAADGSNDTRRLKFWERYHDSIHDMYFALGNSALTHTGTDFKNIRKQMDGRLLGLHSAGPPENNAFIMCIGEYVVVEFGLTGNACFIFRREGLPFTLFGSVAGDGSALKHARHVERLLHVDRRFEKWEDKFRNTLSRLMAVRPAAQPVAPHPVPPPHAAQAVGHRPGQSPSAAAPARPHSQAGRPEIPGRQRVAPAHPQSPVKEFSLFELRQFCASHRLTMQDFREQNGNVWVRATDRDSQVNSQLISWGFAYKNDKGWWRK